MLNLSNNKRSTNKSNVEPLSIKSGQDFKVDKAVDSV